jgi:LysM repeat protein
MTHRWAILTFAATSALLLAGCATYTDLQSTELTAQQNYELMREDYQRLKGKVEGLEMQLEQLRGDMDRARSGPASQVQALQGSLDQLDQRLRAEESARQRDKQEIIDSLSGKITKIISTAAPAPRPKTAARRAGGDGYEHVVEPGQTISAIAAAYGVKASDIMEANGISDPGKLRAGQKLFVPAP